MEDNNKLQTFSLEGPIPNLHTAKVLPLDLTSEYWTPIETGEYKVGFYQEIKISTYEPEDGVHVELPCVIFVEQDKAEQLKTFRNGSKRLVAAIEASVKNGTIERGTPLMIQYLGKRKNSTNQFNSDVWSIKPLIVQNDEQKLEEIIRLFEERKDYVHADDLPYIEDIIKHKEVVEYDKTIMRLREVELPTKAKKK